jgi:hypothetical protein
MFYIGVPTIERECHRTGKQIGFDYMQATVKSLTETSQTTDVCIAVFPSNVEPRPQLHGILADIEIVMPPKDVRLFVNSNRMLTWLVEHVKDEWFLTIQDDQKFTKRALDRIRDVARTLPSDVGMCSFYTPYKIEKQNWEPCRFRHYPARDVYGTLCMLWRVGCAHDFLQSPGVRAHTGWKGWDMVIKRWLMRNGRWSCYRHIPCLAQHVGVVSAAHHAWRGGRQTPNFPGVKFNAMKNVRKQ